jgi:flagellar biosynthesis anti-sigma factor FlgM
MRIDSNRPVATDLTTEKAKNSGKGDNAAATNEQAHDAFSVDTVSVGALQAKALATPEVRQEKVQALRDAIRNGSYEIDPAKVADAMLRDAS